MPTSRSRRVFSAAHSCSHRRRRPVRRRLRRHDRRRRPPPPRPPRHHRRSGQHDHHRRAGRDHHHGRRRHRRSPSACCSSAPTTTTAGARPTTKAGQYVEPKLPGAKMIYVDKVNTVRPSRHHARPARRGPGQPGRQDDLLHLRRHEGRRHRVRQGPSGHPRRCSPPATAPGKTARTSRTCPT